MLSDNTDGSIKIWRSFVPLLAANIIGIFVYLRIEAWIIAPRPEEYALNGFDEGIQWLSKGLPLLALSMVVNTAWLVYAKVKGRCGTGWLVLIGASLLAAWLFALSSTGFSSYIIRKLLPLK